MPDNLSTLDLQNATLVLIASVCGLLVVASALVAVARFIWFHGRPAWLRSTLLAASAGGLLVVAGAVLLPGAPWWAALGGAVLGVGPLATWLAHRHFTYHGPPPALVRGPKVLDDADSILDAIGERAAEVGGADAGASAAGGDTSND